MACRHPFICRPYPWSYNLFSQKLGQRNTDADMFSHKLTDRILKIMTNFAIELLFSVEIFALLKTQFIYASSVNTSKIILLKNAASHFLHAKHDKHKSWSIFLLMFETKIILLWKKMPLNIMRKNLARHFLQAKYDYGRHAHELIHVFYEVSDKWLLLEYIFL